MDLVTDIISAKKVLLNWIYNQVVSTEYVLFNALL